MNIQVPAHIRELLARLEAAGHEAWCVGGCVRDSLLGREPADWDVTTSALPEEILACFPDCAAIEIGRRHGTIGVVTPGGAVEVTTYRRDGAYQGHRRPESVAFSRSLEDDLSRRDFTVNAMAYHPDRGLADRFGGREDLSRGIIRCVGEPSRRFREDALRILRGLRFAAILGFAIEPETARAAADCRELLPGISGERTREELTRLLCGEYVLPVLEAYAPILFAALPELTPLYGCGQETPWHRFGCWGHTIHAVAAIPAAPTLRWAALLHDCGKPQVKSFGPDGRAHFYGHAPISAQIAREVLARLRFPNKEAQRIAALVECHGQPLPISEKRMKKLLAGLGGDGVRELLALIRGDVLSQAEELAAERLPLIDEAEALAERLLAEKTCLARKDLAVNGHDLIDLGYTPGKALGDILDRLLEAVLAGEVANDREALLGGLLAPQAPSPGHKTSGLCPEPWQGGQIPPAPPTG